MLDEEDKVEQEEMKNIREDGVVAETIADPVLKASIECPKQNANDCKDCVNENEVINTILQH